MKKHLLLSLLFSFIFLSISWAQTSNEKIFAKSFNILGHDEVIINVDAKMEVQHWDNPTLRIEMKVSIDSPNPNLIKLLTRTGRYHLLGKTAEEQPYLIFAPKIWQEIAQNASEAIELTVWAPHDVEIVMEKEKL